MVADPDFRVDELPAVSRYTNPTPLLPVIAIIACGEEGLRLWRIIGPALPHGVVFVRLVICATISPSPTSGRYA
jgi:hypothetical protein